MDILKDRTNKEDLEIKTGRDTIANESEEADIILGVRRSRNLVFVSH